MVLVVQNHHLPVLGHGVPTGYVDVLDGNLVIHRIEAVVVRFTGAHLVHQVAPHGEMPAEQLHFPHGQRFAGHDDDPDIRKHEVVGDRPQELPEGAGNPLEGGHLFLDQPLGQARKALRLGVPRIEGAARQ